MSAHADPVIPGAAIKVAAGLVLLTIALAAAVPLGLAPPPRSAEAQRVEAGVPVTAERELRFFDRADGALIVEDAASGATQILAPGENHGFVRGVLRGLARDRKRRGVGQTPPFRLALWANGRLSLTDSATGLTIELDSFGADNRAAFAQLLEGRGA